MKAKQIFNLFSLVMVTLFAGSSAFAMHAYRNAECSGKLPNGKEIRIAFASGSYPLAVLNQEGSADRSDDGGVMNTVELLGSNLDFNADDAPAKLSLQVRYERKMKTHSSWEDRCWKDTGSDYKSVVEVKSVDVELGQQLGIQSGSNILLNCGDNITAPAGNCKY